MDVAVRTEVIPAEAEPSASRSIVVVDTLGEVFGRVRELALPAAVWRVLDARRMASKLAVDLTIWAAYAPIDWNTVGELASHGPTLVISTAYQRGEAEVALRRDLVGYLDAGISAVALDRALRGALLRGEPTFPRELIGAWLRETREPADAGSDATSALTPRQREIIALIAQGATDKQVAATLGIAQATAQKHVTNLLRRLDVPNRAAAVAVTRRATQTRPRPSSERGGSTSAPGPECGDAASRPTHAFRFARPAILRAS